MLEGFSFFSENPVMLQTLQKSKKFTDFFKKECEDGMFDTFQVFFYEKNPFSVERLKKIDGQYKELVAVNRTGNQICAIVRL